MRLSPKILLLAETAQEALEMFGKSSLNESTINSTVVCKAAPGFAKSSIYIIKELMTVTYTLY